MPYVKATEAKEILNTLKEDRQIWLREEGYDCDDDDEYAYCDDTVLVLHDSDGPELDEDNEPDESVKLYGEGGADPRDILIVDFSVSQGYSNGSEVSNLSGIVRFIDRDEFEVIQFKYALLFEDEPTELFSAETIARWDAEAVEAERLAKQREEEERKRLEQEKEAQARRDARGERPDCVLLNGEAFYINRDQRKKTPDVTAILLPGLQEFRVGQLVDLVQPLSKVPTPDEQFQAEVTGFSSTRKTMFLKKIAQAQGLERAQGA